MTSTKGQSSSLKPIKLLIVNNSNSEAKAIALLLFEAGLEVNWQQVSTQADYLACLNPALNVILVDDCQTRLSSTAVLNLLSEKNLDLPVLIINGEPKTSTAVAAIKAGANNYLTKQELNRLPYAIKEALQQQSNFWSRLQRYLHKSEQQLQKLITENADGIIVVNEQGIVQFVNPAALKLLGKSNQQLIGESLGFPVVNGDYLEVDIPQPQGKVAVAQMRVSQIFWQGTTAYIVSLRDITKLKQTEEERAKLLEQAQAANRAKDEFLAVLSHELRTPLNPIVGWSQLISSGNLNQTQIKQGLEIIQRNALLQTQLIEDILDISRIIRGKLKLEASPVNLTAIINNALETVGLAAQAKSIEVVTDLDENIGSVQGDATRLQQVVWNLLSNAIKFTSDGGRVEIHLKKIDGSAQILVKDNGRGIEPEFLPYVFDYFRQAENSSNRTFGGLGLGLAIVRHLVELHGGTIAVDSLGIGQGAIFTVSLPKINDSNRSLSEQSLSQSLGNLRGITVLVVDDDESSRDLLICALENEGAKAIATASGQEALSSIIQNPPNFLISDLTMPGMDGYQLIEQIRQLPAERGGQLFAIAFSAYPSSGDAEKSLAAGFNRHLNKPIDLDNFLEILTQLNSKDNF